VYEEAVVGRSKLITAATFLKSMPREIPYSRSRFEVFLFFLGCCCSVSTSLASVSASSSSPSALSSLGALSSLPRISFSSDAMMMS
jgi:hypothetical protein